MIKDEERRGRPRLLENWTPELIEQRSERYFKRCDDRKKDIILKTGEMVSIPNPAPYSIEGLCCYLAISRNTFLSWCQMPDDIGEAARACIMQILANQVEGGLDGTMAATMTQFMLKNNCPQYYQDKSETQVGVDNRLSELFGELGWKKKVLTN